MPTIGVIANPVSARDIRRVVANASNLQITDRVNIVLRVLTAARACGVDARAGDARQRRHPRAAASATCARARPASALAAWSSYLDMEPHARRSKTPSTRRALMREAGVAAIVVLGGDGTHRAVVRECGDVPHRAALSTGTNNAFPEMRETTITGMAVGAVCHRAAERRAGAGAATSCSRSSIDDGARSATSRWSTP